MPDLLFAGIMHESKTGSPRHSHRCWEMVRYVEGSGTLTVGGRRIPFRPGTIMALPPDVPHEEDAPGGYRCYFVGYEGPKPRGAVPVCQDDEHGSFAAACGLLVRECWQKPSGWQATGEELVRLLQRYVERWSGAGDDLVRQAEALLLEHLADPELRIATVAKRLGVHEEHLRRRFAAATGRSPRAHLSRLRMEAAGQLLAHGRGVAETAAACGFADPFHFSKAYHQATGKAPSTR